MNPKYVHHKFKKVDLLGIDTGVARAASMEVQTRGGQSAGSGNNSIGKNGVIRNLRKHDSAESNKHEGGAVTKPTQTS